MCWKAETLLCQSGPYSQGYGFPSGHIQLWELDCKEGSAKELMSSNCGAGEGSWESPGQQRDQTSNLKGNQPWILRSTDVEAETPVFGHLMWTVDSLEKSLMLGKIEGRRRERKMMRWLDEITDAMDMNLGNFGRWSGTVSWHVAVHGVTKSQTQLGDWTTTIEMF